VTVTENGLFPAEHRALRELHAFARQLAGHWSKLARRLDGPEALERGAAAGRELMAECSERSAAYGVQGFPLAQGVGGRAAALRGVGDVLLERNQALRSALHDVQHLGTLLAYLAALADRRGDAELAAWHRGWEARLRELEEAARAAAVAQASDPERAIEPADPGRIGRSGHAIANGLSTLGEAVDGSAIGRAARRLAGR
jgi:hypothetical protein